MSGDGGEPEVDAVRRRDYLEEFRAYTVDELGRSPKTAEHYFYCLRTLAKWAGKPVHKIGSDDLRAFKRAKHYSPSTIQSVVVAMHQFHKWGALEGYWKTNGLLAVPTPRVVQEVQPPVPIATARALLGAAQNPTETRIVYLGLYAGCRISESAKIDETNWGFDRLTFIGKGSKKRVVPLHPELSAVKTEILAHQPASVGVLHSSLDRIRTRLDARDGWGRLVRSHALRRTFATALYEAGVPYEVLAKLLGHGADVTARYARIPFSVMSDAISALSYFSGQPVQLELFASMGAGSAVGDGGELRSAPRPRQTD